MTALPRPLPQLRLVFSPREVRLSPGARVAVRNYARRAPFMDPRDLEQTAALTILEARARGRQESAAIVARVLMRYSVAERSPVAIPDTMGIPGTAGRLRWERAASVKRESLASCYEPVA